MPDIARLAEALTDRYILEREVGSGGMATVYLARDVRHDRRVAIKVLRAELSAVLGGERFLAEIRTTAALQHPHILPLYDSGSAAGLFYYVMPLVEGDTLRDRLSREKQLSIVESVRIATEIASALDYAHRHGVIHRDIKPENILLHDGSALVADFGIALAVQHAGSERMTQTGLSLGTPQYMSPEQAMGEREITVRSDIYALGAVTYEMLVGEPPFTGPTIQAIVARLLTEEPRAPASQRKSIPPHMEHALLTALAKVPADRFESAAQFAEALRGSGSAHPPVSTAPLSTSGTPSAPLGRRARHVVGATMAASVLLAGAGVWAWSHPRANSSPLPVRFVLTLPPSAPLLESDGSELLLSPDGRTLVYATTVAGSRVLARREADQLVPTLIAGTERAVVPIISPDGKWVAFFSGGQLKKVPIDGGPPTVVASVPQPHGADWGQQNLIVLGAHAGVDGLSRVSAVSTADGRPHAFTTSDSAAGEGSQRWPRLLADGVTVLYTSWGSGGLLTARIGIASLKTGKCTILDLPGSHPFGVFEGQLIYARADGALMAAPVDLGARRVTGEPVVLVPGVSIGADGASNAALSDNGTLAYVTGSVASRLVLVGAGGAVRTLIPDAREYETPRFSPDGKRIAVAINGRPPDIWVADITAGTLTRITSEAANIRPEWTPDGKRIVFLSNRSGESGVWWRAADVSGPPRKSFESRDDALEALVAADGSVVLYRANQSGGSYGVWFRSLADFSTPKPFFTTSNSQELMPSLSPDGHWLAYASDETGATEVYVRPFPGPAARYLVSAGGGSEPRWAPDGRRLFYRSGRKMLAVRVSTVPAFSISGRELLFEGNYATNPAHQNYDVTRDGQGFLLLQRVAEPDVVMVINWLSELRARVRVAQPR